MRKLKWILIVCFTGTSLFASSDEVELQIKKFRFNRHMKLGFERLVIEFSSKANGKSTPVIRILPDKSGKETTVHVSQASLVGAIPESAINDSYVKKSQYFGPISINSDSTSGFDIRTFIKQSHSIVDAFWLEKPSRLIVDVFTKSSDRAQGPNMVLKRATASVASKNPTAIESGKVEPEGSKAMPSSVDWTKSEKPGDEAVLCFPANTQVKANIGFEKSAEAPVVPANIDNTYAKTASNGQDMIVCYPKGAQV
ncbi:MAG: hypothetical protein ACKOA8_19405, partial [Deltaproteobacteria bacterium]